MPDQEKKSGIRNWLILVLFLVVGVAGYFFYSRSSQMLESAKMDKYTAFVSQDPALAFTFEYSKKEWSPREARGQTEKYNAVYLEGPLVAEKRFKTLVEVVVKPLGTEQSASGLLDAFLKRISGWPKLKVVQQKTLDVAGVKASSAVYESEAMLPVESLNAKPAMVQEQVVFVARNDRSYRFSFHTLAEQWKTYHPEFEHLLKTFKFKD